MNRILPIALLLGCLVMVHQAAHAERLKVGVLVYSPYVVRDGAGKISGPLTDLVKQAVAHMGHEVDFISLPFARGVNWLKTGEVDAFFPFFKTREREDFSIFPEEPIGVLVMALFAKPGLAGKFDGNFDSLAGLSVVRVRKTLQSPAFDQAVKDKTLKEVKVGSIDQQFQMLAHGRADLAIADRLAAKNVLSIKSLHSEIIEMAPPVISRDIFMAFSRKKRSQAIADKFSFALRELRRN